MNLILQIQNKQIFSWQYLTNEVKRQIVNWEKISNFHNEVLLFLIYNELQKFEKENTNNPIKKKTKQ